MVNRFGSIVVSVNGIVDVNDSTADVADDSALIVDEDTSAFEV